MKVSKNKILLGLIIFHLFILGVNWNELRKVHQNIFNDSVVINMVGQIRGSIQRVSKLYFMKQPLDNSIQLIEKNFKLLNDESFTYYCATSKKLLHELSKQWIEFKSLLYSCNNKESNCQFTILSLSEKFWTHTDKIVKILEVNSLDKLNKLRNVYEILAFEIMLIFISILFLLKILKKEKIQMKLLVKNSRYTAMGEMIANIAHQWRQPLTALGIILAKLKVADALEKVDSKMIEDTVKKSDILIASMSTTIDDFRNFFKPNKKKEVFIFQEIFEKVAILVETQIKSSNIELKKEFPINPVYIFGHSNEFIQVLISIIKNAEDAIKSNSIKNGYITISVDESDLTQKIIIKDNAGGVSKDIIKNIFEPYFTTKQELNGTGIGLYMCKQIIEEHMDGKLSVANIDEGASFIIELRKPKM